MQMWLSMNFLVLRRYCQNTMNNWITPRSRDVNILTGGILPVWIAVPVYENQWSSNISFMRWLLNKWKQTASSTSLKIRELSKEAKVWFSSQEHSNICEYEDASCDYCPNGVQRRLLNEHTTECQNRIVQCEYCEKEIVFRLREVRLVLKLGKQRHARKHRHARSTELFQFVN